MLYNSYGMGYREETKRKKKGSSNRTSGLRRFNNFLSVIVIALGIYITVTPILPELQFLFKKKTGHISSELNYSDKNEPGKKPIPKDNRLVIPQIGLDANVFEGKYADTLKKGMWRRPKTSTPDQGGNTVIVGHRFTYKDPAIFYHLDKLKMDDTFALYWQGKEYLYKVSEIKIVEPHQIEVEDQTTDPTLTLYTCTPLWTSKQRLVVVAHPINSTPPTQDNEPASNSPDSSPETPPTVTPEILPGASPLSTPTTNSTRSN